MLHIETYVMFTILLYTAGLRDIWIHAHKLSIRLRGLHDDVVGKNALVITAIVVIIIAVTLGFMHQNE
jgi:hypothetical protein